LEKLGVSHDDDFPERNFFVCASNNLDELADKILPTSPNFALFIAMDPQSIADEKVKDFAKSLFSRGLASFSAWGPECEKVHDLFDAADAEVHPGKPTCEDFIMTTWHSRESLKSALWGFVHAGMTASNYEQTCKEWIIAVLENPAWEEEIRTSFSKINTLSEED
jgi:hypothetical protein